MVGREKTDDLAIGQIALKGQRVMVIGRRIQRAFACRRRDLPPSYGRGVEQLPSDVRHRFASSLVRAYEPEALKESLRGCVAALVAECVADAEIDQAMSDRLLETVAGI